MTEALKCDAPGCDHIQYFGKITADMVGMPCPKCSADLLTSEDWQKWQPISSLLTSINGIEGCKEDQDACFSVGLHGSKITIEIDPPKENE